MEVLDMGCMAQEEIQSQMVAPGKVAVGSQAVEMIVVVGTVGDTVTAVDIEDLGVSRQVEGCMAVGKLA